MIKGYNFLCFGSGNWNYPGFQQTIMKNFSLHNNIIFINPLGSRKIVLNTSQMSAYSRRFIRIFKKSIKTKNNCIVCSPWNIPLVYNHTVKRINKVLLKYQINILLKKHKFEKFILWIGTPTAELLLNILNPEFIVYNPVDRYSEFNFVNGAKIKLFEKTISEKSDLILCTSDAIRKDLTKFNKEVYTITHGVDTTFFKPLQNGSPPKCLENLKKPIIGFIGGLADWVDYKLLYRIACSFPDAYLVLIGKKYDKVNFLNLENLPNVLWLGPKNFSDLPRYLNMFSICLIPYIINERLVAVDPIKLREYLAMGKPVVSVNLPEVKKLKNLVYIGFNHEDFIKKINLAFNENNSKLENKRLEYVKGCDWFVKNEEISHLLEKSYKIKYGSL
jgi:Glycosyl transferases group 1